VEKPDLSGIFMTEHIIVHTMLLQFMRWCSVCASDHHMS